MEISNKKHVTRLINVILVGLGLVLFVFGIFTWQSFDSVSGIFISMLEGGGYAIPDSIATWFKQITIMYVLITVIGMILAFVGGINELDSFFEVK
ncbi:MAG: hypothetical protein PVF15_11355 [Candidatus Bathyarchaeota archaeon]|jgi:hypothetical protein